MQNTYIFFFILLLSLPVYPGGGKGGNDIKDILMREAKIHPQMEVQDLYKFIHQASFGSEHAVKDTASVREWMDNELKTMDLNIEDELITFLSPDSSIVRVNLRPYVNKGYSPEKLLDAFIKTANTYKGSKDTFMLYRKKARELAEEGVFNFTAEQMDKFFDDLSARGLPAVHHSDTYERLYKPAYRVVERKYVEEIIRAN
jgi:hypothetical protein